MIATHRTRGGVRNGTTPSIHLINKLLAVREDTTMTRSFRTLSVITVALGLSADAFAHHSTTYYSKEQKDFVKIEGKVVRWEYRSPHSQLYIETTDKDGKLVTWRFESTPAAWLAREGITKDSINFGDAVVVEGF